jgi:hypothetical protein
MWREQLALTDRRVHRCTAFTISHVVNIGGSIPPLASPTIGWRPATLRRGGGGAREELGVWSLVENRSDTELPKRVLERAFDQPGNILYRVLQAILDGGVRRHIRKRRRDCAHRRDRRSSGEVGMEVGAVHTALIGRSG